MPGIRSLLIALVTVAALSAATAASAQTETAAISGRIADEQGLAIADARVRATHVDTGIESATASNAEGVFVIGGLRPGRYRLLVEKAGFKPVTLDDLELAVQDVLGRNFTMELGPVTDRVTVTTGDERNLSPAVSTVVGRDFVETMPLNGRSFQSLIQLTPGVLVMAAGQGIEGQFSTNGQRTNTNYFTVDGVTMNFATNVSVNVGQNVGGTLPVLTIGGGTNSFVSVDAMQEFRTQTSSYAAEYGRSPGAQIAIVTKAGTNRFQGTLYDYIRNAAFDARNWFNRPPEPKPALRQQDFGGTLGGPLRTDRSFFFFSYELLRLDQPRSATGVFFTQDARAAVAPVYQAAVNALPLPDGPLVDPACDNVTTACRATLTASFSNPTRFDATSLRLDQTFGRRFRAFARVSHTPSSTTSRSFASVETTARNADSVTAGLTSVLRGSTLNDLRINGGRSSGEAGTAMDTAFGAVPPTMASLPRVDRPGLQQSAITFAGGSGVGVGARVSHRARQLNVVDTMSFALGDHTVKAGIDYRYFETAVLGTNLGAVQVTTFEQARSGTMGIVLLSVTDPITVRVHNSSVFAQDTWRAGPALTLTYGVRWEIDTPLESTDPNTPLYAVSGVFDSQPVGLAPAGTPLWRTRYNDIAPRLGAAYQVTPSTVVRAGAGLYYDLGYGKPLGDLIRGFPYTRARVIPAAGQPYAPNSSLFVPPPFSTTLSSATQGAIAAFDPDLRLPRTLQWNVAVEHEIGAAQSVSVTYVGADGRRLLRPDFVVPPAIRALGAPPISVTRNAGSSRYQALQMQFQRRLSRGLQALMSYTLANARDTESDDAGGNFLGAALNTNYAISLDAVYVPPLAPADVDVRHTFYAAASYQIPTAPLGAVGRAVLKDWAVDAIVRSASAPPLNVRIEGISPELGVHRTQPDLVPGESIWLSAPDEPGGRILNPNAFTLPAAGVPGNFPRNSIRSPFSLNQTDLAIRRRFSLPRASSLELRAEFFNLFNHPMFGGYSSPVTFWGRCTATPCVGKQSPAFGKVADPYTLNVGLGGDPLSGGQSAIYAVGGPRSVQLSLKLRF